MDPISAVISGVLAVINLYLQKSAQAAKEGRALTQAEIDEISGGQHQSLDQLRATVARLSGNQP